MNETHYWYIAIMIPNSYLGVFYATKEIGFRVSSVRKDIASHFNISCKSIVILNQIEITEEDYLSGKEQ